MSPFASRRANSRIEDENPFWPLVARVVTDSKVRYTRLEPGVAQHDRLLHESVRRHLVAIDNAVTRREIPELHVLVSELHQALDAIYAASVVDLGSGTDYPYEE